MVARRRTAGFSVLEATIALTVVGLVATAFVSTGPAQIRASSTAFRAAAARRLASSVLEETPRHRLTEGATDVDITCDALPEARAERHVRALEPGLYEVEAVVTWYEPGDATPRTERLVTLRATEEPR